MAVLWSESSANSEKIKDIRKNLREDQGHQELTGHRAFHYPTVVESLNAILKEAEIAEQQIIRTCDKYLQRFDPPSVALFGGFSYSIFAARLLERYLDASIVCIGSRSRPSSSEFKITATTSLTIVKDMIEKDPPDLIIGSSFERMIRPSAAFVPFTYPLRGTVKLRARPLIGIQGELGLMEDVLNACMDQTLQGPGWMTKN
jgi:nitrogenase molybdenum-iron protein alpha/beta subunit